MITCSMYAETVGRLGVSNHLGRLHVLGVQTLYFVTGTNPALRTLKPPALGRKPQEKAPTFLGGNTLPPVNVVVCAPQI